MKEIHVSQIIAAVEGACIDANTVIGEDIARALKDARDKEMTTAGRSVLDTLIENAAIAKVEKMAICQDTGMVVVFAELGQDVHITGGLFTEAIHEGVRRGYEKGFLRKSVVSDPVLRTNTGDNTPAVIHVSLVAGNGLRLNISPKGFGSENMSRLFMLKPSDGIDGVKRAVIDTVSMAGANPCPPIVVGVGVGGTMEKAALMAKEAVLIPIGERNSAPHWCNLEQELQYQINLLGIGPGGLGGRTTCLDVHILAYPTHIAGLPLAVNISCHVTRHRTVCL